MDIDLEYIYFFLADTSAYIYIWWIDIRASFKCLEFKNDMDILNF